MTTPGAAKKRAPLRELRRDFDLTEEDFATEESIPLRSTAGLAGGLRETLKTETSTQPFFPSSTASPFRWTRRHWAHYNSIERRSADGAGRKEFARALLRRFLEVFLRSSRRRSAQRSARELLPPKATKGRQAKARQRQALVTNEASCCGDAAACWKSDSDEGPLPTRKKMEPEFVSPKPSSPQTRKSGAGFSRIPSRRRRGRRLALSRPQRLSSNTPPLLLSPPRRERRRAQKHSRKRRFG